MRKKDGPRGRIWPLLLLAGGLATALLISFAWSLFAGVQEDADKAQAILDRVSSTPRNVDPQQASATVSEPPQNTPAVLPLPSSGEPSACGPFPDLAWEMLACFRETEPRLDDVTVQLVTQRLEARRIAGTLTPSEESLDPSEHSPTALRSTLCKMLRDSKMLADMRADVRSATDGDAHGLPRQRVNRAREAMEVCTACELADGNAEAALNAYIDLCRAYYLGNPLPSASLLTDDKLPTVLDAFAGAVPAPIARKLLALLALPEPIEALRNYIATDAAQSVKDTADYKLKQLAHARTEGFLTQCLIPNQDNLILKMVKPNPAAGMFEMLERLLPLLDMQPYQMEPRVDDLLRTIPSEAWWTNDCLERARRLHALHHRHLAMVDTARTAIALKQYKADHGTYPESLDGLTPTPIPTPPLDPFTGQPMVYAKDGDGFAIRPPSTKQVERVRQPSWKALR